MKTKKNTTRQSNKEAASTPKEVKTRTQILPQNFGKLEKDSTTEEVSECEVEQAVAIINPDVNSMESRG